MSLASCITRQEIRANVWLTNAPVPPEICRKAPELKDYGFYRRLNDGTFEFVSFCTPSARRMISIVDTDFQRILDALLPKE